MMISKNQEISHLKTFLTYLEKSEDLAAYISMWQQLGIAEKHPAF